MTEIAMLPDERRRAIAETIERKGFASLQVLVDRVDASESTVRRDLELLEEIGQVRRTRGGAAYVGESLPTFDDRQTHALREKQRIAKRTVELIGAAEAILLDGGTTTLEVARQLVGRPLQVVTNSLPIANVLAPRNEIELIMLAGYLYPRTGVALGSHTVAALERIHVRRLIMGAGGITEDGLFNGNMLLVEAEKKMMQVAEEVVVVCDSSKLGHVALEHLCALSAVDRLVIDSGMPDRWHRVFEQHGIVVDVVDV